MKVRQAKTKPNSNVSTLKGSLHTPKLPRNMAMQGPEFAKKQGNMDIMAHYPRHMPTHTKPTHPLYPFIMHTHGLRNKRPCILTI